jgi:hypothetical protein
VEGRGQGEVVWVGNRGGESTQERQQEHLGSAGPWGGGARDVGRSLAPHAPPHHDPSITIPSFTIPSTSREQSPPR